MVRLIQQYIVQRKLLCLSLLREQTLWTINVYQGGSTTSSNASNGIFTGGKYTAGTLLGSVTISSSNATLGTSGGPMGGQLGQPGGQSGQMSEPPSGQPGQMGGNPPNQ